MDDKIRNNRHETALNWIKSHISLLLFLTFAIIFSYFLMFYTFSYQNGNILINERLWSDFLSHIPLIRSFSYGDNIPPEYPIYSGEKIRYHFFFYFLVGQLEKLGLRIDIALNLLSVIGMVGLLVGIYFLTIKITKSKIAGWLAAVMILFNSSLSWLYFIRQHSLSTNIISEVINNPKFPAFGPYDGSILSAFWHLNIYTNQRHLAFAFALMFAAIWAIYYSNKKWALALGIIIIGIMPWLHKAVLLILVVNLGCLFLSDSKKRKRLLIAGIIGAIMCLPGLLYLNSKEGEGITYLLGFIYKSEEMNKYSFSNEFIKWCFYWFINLGILPILGLAGWVTINKIKFKNEGFIKNLIKFYQYIFSPERAYGVSALIIFILANTFSFAVDAATNHKLINYSIFILNIYASYFIVKLFRKNYIFKFLAVIMTFFVILGGVIDIFPIINTRNLTVADIPNNITSQWVLNNTKKDARFFNLTYDTLPVSLAGRRIFWGWDYFTWSIGYDLTKRKTEMTPVVLGQDNKEESCSYFKRQKLNYIYIDNEDSFLDLPINKTFFNDNFTQVSPEVLPYKIYSIDSSCN